MADRVLNCVNKKFIHVVDLKYALLEKKTRNNQEYRSYFNVHMTYEGNYFVALKLKEAINKK